MAVHLALPNVSSRNDVSRLDEEATLVKAAKAGNNAAFSELVSRHDRRLFKIAQYIVQNAHDAEDVVQESFLKAFQNLKRFREESRFSTWMVRIVVNHALMKLRQRKAVASVSLDMGGQEDNSAPLELADCRIDPEQELHTVQVRERLTNAIRELNPLFRAVFVLRDVQGLSIAETAEALKISIPLVKTRLLRARLRLRQRLSVYFRDSHWPVAGRAAAMKTYLTTLM